MDIKLLEDTLKTSFNNQFSIIEKRPNLYQILLPLFYPDGDMLDIFVSFTDDSKYLISDCGMTLMRLSYNFEIDTEHKFELFQRILVQQEARYDEQTGSILLDSSIEQLFNRLMQFSQIISQIINLKMLQRKTISSLFYDDVKAYIGEHFTGFKVENNYRPINEDEDLIVDFAFLGDRRSVYVFPVKGSNKTQSAIITILRLQQQLKEPFTSVLLHENVDTLTKSERRVSMKVADKQFADLNSFKESANEFLTRALA